jgi:ribosomal protein L25 (general stress protein Ctc)
VTYSEKNSLSQILVRSQAQAQASRKPNTRESFTVDVEGKQRLKKKNALCATSALENRDY